MRIGELAQVAGTDVDTIRYYEKSGLMPAPPRSVGNYRQYGPDQATRLAFIRHCRALDMSLDEVRTLLAFCDAPARECEGVNALLEDHISHVRERIGELQALEKTLIALRRACKRVERADSCGILNTLKKGERPRPTNKRRGHV
jgi:Cd(II)/Pb(II)-responsive transcriptional regulator